MTQNTPPSESAGTARPRRRVVVPAPEGSEPEPIGEPERHREDDNDERLKAEKPPHY